MKVFKCGSKCKNKGTHYFRLKAPTGVLISGHFCDKHFLSMVREHTNWGKAYCYVEKKKGD